MLALAEVGSLERKALIFTFKACAQSGCGRWGYPMASASPCEALRKLSAAGMKFPLGWDVGSYPPPPKSCTTAGDGMLGEADRSYQTRYFIFPSPWFAGMRCSGPESGFLWVFLVFFFRILVWHSVPQTGLRGK